MGDIDETGDTTAELASASRDRNSRMLLYAATGIVGIPILSCLAFGCYRMIVTKLAKEIGRVDVAELGHSVEMRSEIGGGSRLLFALDTGYAYTGSPTVKLDVALLKDGAEISRADCTMKSFGGGGAGEGHGLWYGDAGSTCEVEVPGSGATSLRAKVDRAGVGALTLQGTRVIVKRR